MTDYHQWTVVQLKQELDKRGKLDKTGTKDQLCARLTTHDTAAATAATAATTNGSAVVTMETDIKQELALTVEDMDPGESLLNPLDDTTKWFQLLRWEEERGEEIVDDLHRMNLLVANALVYKDYCNDRDWKTATLSPVSPSNMSMPGFSPLVTQCIRYNLHMEPTQTGTMQGHAKMFFKKRSDLQRNLQRLKAISPNIQVHIMEEFTDDSALETKKQKHQADFFKIKAAAEDHATAIRNDELTLFTPSIPEQLSEDQLWRIFPEAHYIILTKKPFCHAYIQFESEEKLQAKLKSLELMPNAPADLPKLRMMLLTDSRKGFFLHHQKNVNVKKKKRPAQFGGAQGGASVNTPPPNQQRGSLTSPTSATGAVGQSQASVSVMDTGVDTEGMSKSKIRRMKAKRKKLLAREMDGGEGQTMDQGQGQQMSQAQGQGFNMMGSHMGNQGNQGQGNQPQFGAGLNLLLQTLGNLAQGMGGGPQLEQQIQNMGQQMQNQPGAGQGRNKKKNKKRKKKKVPTATLR